MPSETSSIFEPSSSESRGRLWQISVNRRGLDEKLAFGLNLVVALLFSGDLLLGQEILISHRSLLKIFTVTRYDALPNWVASVGLTFSACLCWLMAAAFRQIESRRAQSRAWFWIGTFVFVGAMDMGAAIHQNLSSAMRDQVDNLLVGRDGKLAAVLQIIGQFQWQMVMVPLYLLGAVFVFDFVRQNVTVKEIQNRFMLAISIFSFGLLASYLQVRYSVYTSGRLFGLTIGQFNHALELAQATFKLLGVAYLIRFLVSYGISQIDELNLRWGDAS